MLRFSTPPAPRIPPPDLLFRSSGTQCTDWYLQSGERTYSEFAEVLTQAGHSFGEFRSILDFGCGCGRILRVLRRQLPRTRLSACDQDQVAVGWVRRAYPDVDVRGNLALPPLMFSRESFDLILGFSIFTHLDAFFQDAWLTELHRVARPGGLLLLTVHGPEAWQRFSKDSPLKVIPELQAQLDAAGFVYWSGDSWTSYFPDFYHTAWHTPAYIRAHWGRWFNIVDILPARALGHHDIVVLRRS